MYKEGMEYMNTDVMAQSLLDSLSLIINTISSYVGSGTF